MTQHFARAGKFALILVAIFLVPAAAFAAGADDLARLGFLIGKWDVEGAEGTTTFERALNDHMIIRKSWSHVPASGARPASNHEDLMVIFLYGDHLRAAYYDSDGYVVGYEVHARGRNEVVFVSDVMQGVPRVRVTYTLGSNDVLATSMEVAPANRTEAFAPSMAWNSRRARR